MICLYIHFLIPSSTFYFGFHSLLPKWVVDDVAVIWKINESPNGVIRSESQKSQENSNEFVNLSSNITIQRKPNFNLYLKMTKTILSKRQTRREWSERFQFDQPGISLKEDQDFFQVSSNVGTNVVRCQWPYIFLLYLQWIVRG